MAHKYNTAGQNLARGTMNTANIIFLENFLVKFDFFTKKWKKKEKGKKKRHKLHQERQKTTELGVEN